MLVNSGKNSVFLHLVKSSFRLSLGFKNDFVLMPSSSLFLLGQFIVRDAACKTILAANLIVIVCMKLREIISLFLASIWEVFFCNSSSCNLGVEVRNASTQGTHPTNTATL